MVVEKVDEYLKNWRDKGDQLMLLLILFCLIFAIKMVPILLILSFLFPLILGVKLPRWKEFSPIIMLSVLFLSMYFLNLLGLAWTNNMSVGMEQLEYKLSFLLVPAVFLVYRSTLNRSHWMTAFIYGLAVTALWMLVYAAYRSISDEHDNRWGYFEESLLCIFMHRSYTAAYFVIGVALSMVGWLKENKSFWWIFTLLFSMVIILSGSKAGVISFVIVILWSLMSYTIQIRALNGKRVFSILIASTALLFLVFKSNVNRRFGIIKTAISEIQWDNNPSTESTTARLLMWNASYEVWKMHPFFGVGTGDVNDELVEWNQDRANRGVAESRLNAHNQFLNFSVQFGIVGVLVLTMVFILLFYWAIQFNDQVLAMLTVVFFINFFFESFLETRAGILPFTVLLLSYLLVIKGRRGEV
jgi:O-antigen ligase